MRKITVIAAVSVAALVIVALWASRVAANAGGKAPAAPSETCSSCSAGLDPVSDPAYNMVNICKQSVLLEEHLNNEKKRCGDCIKKHMLHIVGLAEEAVSLAGTEAEPLMLEAAESYEGLMRDYLDGKDPLGIAEGCRAERKKLMAKYVV